MRTRLRAFLGVLVTLTLALFLAVACGDDDESTADSADSAATAVPEEAEDERTTSTSVPPDAPTTPEPTPHSISRLDVEELVAQLAADELNGRNNQTPASDAAQELIIEQLVQFAEPAVPGAAGSDGYRQSFESGTNIVGVIPGGDRADEYVMIGAHYDHLGPGECDTLEYADDGVCNGATDNATAVGELLDIASVIADADGPSRSVILAIWDAEEDGLQGSRHYVADPLFPLEQTVAYVNFDIQGANVLPSLANSTLLIGAETGGAPLIDSATNAVAASELSTSMLSLIFGQGRSDHAVLADAGVPVVFFTEGTNGCYHTVKDDIDTVDFDKLALETSLAEILIRDLVATDTPPVFDANAPLSTFADAEQLLEMAQLAEEDRDLYPQQAAEEIDALVAQFESIVAAGPEAYDEAATTTVLVGAATLVGHLADLDCGIA